MMTPEETKVLTYLRKRLSATVADVATTCFSGTPPEWVSRIIANLDWLGYLTVYYGPGGTPAALQITDKGLAMAGGRLATSLR